MSTPALRRIRLALWLPLILFCGFMVVTLYQLKHPPSTDVVSALVGKPLPAFTLAPGSPDRPGVATADLATGKPRLLNIFASWCIPCAVESPQLATLAKEGVEIDGVAIRDHPEDLAGFLARNGNPYTRIGADPVGTVQLEIGSSGVPETYVIDGKGVIRYQHIGDIREEQLPLIRQKLAEAAQ
jgi:cytochrome c biogenesis protein CcmG/thiol:disulfide interchange protein DsbE